MIVLMNYLGYTVSHFYFQNNNSANIIELNILEIFSRREYIMIDIDDIFVYHNLARESSEIKDLGKYDSWWLEYFLMW